MGNRSRLVTRAACELLESRRLLAASPFPDPYFVRAWGGGWDFKKNESPGIPSTLGSTAADTRTAPRYTLQLAGSSNVIPVEAISWGGSAPGLAGSVDPKTTKLDEFGLTVDAGPYSGALLEAVASHRALSTATLRGTDAQGRQAWEWDLAEVTLPSLQTVQNAGGPGHAYDSFQLTFDRVAVTYTD